MPRLTVKDAGILLGTTLNPETDYKIVGQSDHVDVGQTGTVDIEGQGNYKGVRKGIEFRIIPPNGSRLKQYQNKTLLISQLSQK